MQRVQSAVMFAVGFALISVVINVTYTITNHSQRSELTCHQ